LLIGSFFLIFNPEATAAFTVYVVSFALIIYGIQAIYLSFKLKKVKNDYVQLNEKFESEN